jgi:hypothetical protein
MGGAVVDRSSGAREALVLLPVDKIAECYINHFSPTTNRRAA